MDKKKILRILAYWFVPLGLESLLKDIYIRYNEIVDYNNYFYKKKLIAKNSSLKGIHTNERCFILLTGPSINNQDLKGLKNETCIAASNFFVHPDYSLIKPDYYCIAASHPPITDSAWDKWMEEIDMNIVGGNIFFAVNDVESIKKGNRFNKILVNYLDFSGSWNKSLRKGIDISKPLPPPQSVSIIAIFIAIHLGFKEIYLLGCDHDWILHYGESRHFYEEKKHALNREGYDEWSCSDLSDEFKDNLTLWIQYKYLREIAEKNSTKIINSTEGGLLDLFERVTLSEVLSQK